MKKLLCRIKGHRWSKRKAINNFFMRGQIRAIEYTKSCERCGTPYHGYWDPNLKIDIEKPQVGVVDQEKAARIVGEKKAAELADRLGVQPKKGKKR